MVLCCVLLTILLCSNFIALFSDAALSLKQANVVFRHGQRAPISENFTAQYSHVWPNGPGELTQDGKEMMFELGLFFRQRYNHLINSSYNHKEIFMKSSFIDRAIMSGELVLAGLYTPTQQQDIWRPNMTWQPIPIHTLERSTDNVIAMSAPCSHAKQLGVTFEDVVSQHDKTATLQPYLDILKNHSEYKRNEWMDAFMCMKSNNVTLPDWVSEDLYKVSMFEILPLGMHQVFGSVAQQRIYGGPLIKEMIDNMKTCAEDKECSTYRLHGYSGHDSTLGALMLSLGVFNELWPPYAAAVMIELYANEGEEHMVQVWYRNETTGSHPPHLLNIPGCGSNCTLSQFIKATEGVVADDRQAECSLYTVIGYTLNYKTFVMISVALAVGFLMLLVISILLCFRMRRQRGIKFRKMPRSARESITLMSSVNESDEDI